MTRPFNCLLRIDTLTVVPIGKSKYESPIPLFSIGDNEPLVSADIFSPSK